MNKKILWMFAMFMVLAGAAGAQSVLDNSLSLHNVSVYPNPVLAGGNVTIRFQLYDSYGSFVQTINLQAEGSYPLLNVSPSNTTDISEVNPGVNKPYYSYTLHIPATAPSGEYKIYFNASYYGLGATEMVASSSMPVSFYVQNKPEIKALLSNPSPSALYSGYNQTVGLVVENTGYGTARNVSVDLVSGTGINILSSVSKFFISNLTQGQSVTEPILVSAKNTGNASIYVGLSYYSSTFSQHFSSVQDVNLSIAPSAQFSISSQAGQSVGSGATDVPVSFDIRNTGTSDASQLQLSLESNYPITPVASTAYISNLPVGASQNVTFLVSVDSQGVPGNYPVTLYEQWKQPNGAANQQFSGSENYFVNVGNQTSTVTLAVAIIVVIAVAGFVVYRMRSRHAQKQAKKK